jgi:sarcosine oxidase, subunit alpha
VPPEGASVLDASGMRGRGFVTASCMSGAVGRSVALAMIEDGRRLMDATVELFTPAGTRHRARVVRPAFFDPRGERMRG